MDEIYSQVTELMIDTVDFYPRSTTNKYNEPTYGAVVSVRGRLMADNEKVQMVDGTEVTNVGKFITYGPQESITVNHKMIVGTTLYRIHSVDTLGDENGAHHTVITFGY